MQTSYSVSLMASGMVLLATHLGTTAEQIGLNPLLRPGLRAPVLQNAAGVKTLNGLSGRITIKGESNVAVRVAGSSILISSTAGTGPVNITGEHNGIGPDAHGSTISGGTYNAIMSSENAYSRHATISGGGDNLMEEGNSHSTISGGEDNFIGNSSRGSTIGGGEQHRIRAQSSFATIAGGLDNLVSGQGATIGGGLGNVAEAPAATVPGGTYNIANGTNAFAAGQGARALHDGSFVWADSSFYLAVISSQKDEFTARASGGFRFFTSTNQSSGAVLPPGAGSWSSASDRAAKANIVEVNPREILERVAALPIATWNYKTQSEDIKHIGPMAQDFRNAFAVGEDDKHISNVDADGVALAAIKGLHQLLKEKDSQIAELKAQLQELHRLVHASAARQSATASGTSQ